MSNDEKMTIDERRKYLRLVKPHYRKAGRKEKGQLLDEMAAITGLDRKTLIRLMNGSLERKPRSREREKTYGPAVDDALCVIYESFDGICAERLTPNLVWMACHLDTHAELEGTPDVLEVLVDKDGNMSPANAGRFLRMLADREPVFEAKLNKVKPARGETRAEVEEYFRDKYERLKAFLRQAMDRKECIQCSL